MELYHALLRDILAKGAQKPDRTGTGVLSVFGRQLRFNLEEGLPIVTTKKIHLKSVIVELLWFLKGETNVRYLHAHGVTIWDEWADETGNLGPIYGHQWCFWPAPDGGAINQIADLVQQIRERPHSRRLLLTALNIADFPDESQTPADNVRAGRMALAPCHCLAQFYVHGAKLSCLLYCRSQDVFLGTPFNIASYALLTHLLAHQCHLSVGELIWSGGDCHIYLNHLEQVQQLLTRTPYPLPRLRFARKPDDIFGYRIEDFIVDHYQHHPAIKAPIAV